MTPIKTHLKIESLSVSRGQAKVRQQHVSMAVRVCIFTVWLVVSCVCVHSVRAQEQADSSDKTSSVTDNQASTEKQSAKVAKVSAREAVRLGNKQLLEGDAEGALAHYADAEQLEPGAPQIAYVKGLGYFAADNFIEARQAFEQAAASENEKIAGDALYGAGITYHAEALASLDDPKAAIGKLESALERYRTVLAHEPSHQAAKNAGLKAATLRRQLIQQLEQQEPQDCDNPQESDEEKESDGEEKEKKDGEQSSDKDDEQEQEKQDQQQDGDQQEEQDKQQSSEDKESENEESDKSESKGNDEQEQSDSSKQDESSEEKQQEKQAQQAKDNAEEDKKEQAQRRLREMMDAMRNRKKRRPDQPLPIPVKPIDKDW